MKIFVTFIKTNSIKIIGILLLLVFYAYLYKLLIPRINAFGCMDDCNNFMGGYFLLHGKVLFTQIFFNHAPFMAHISEFIQFISRPTNLHEIILRHRQFVLLFGLTCEILLLMRFGWVAFPFALTYELTKFYLGGDRFLAEGLIVYPMVYLIGITYEKFLKKTIFTLDYYAASVCVWFVLFIREPYAPAVVFLFIGILWGKKQRKQKILSSLSFIVLFCITLFSYNLSEFLYNIVYVNKTNLSAENAQTGFFGINIYKSFVYPFLIFIHGEWNFVRYIEMGIAALFLFVNGIFLWRKRWHWLLFLWIALGLANIRFVVPGHEYYGAFHLLPWYAMTIFITLLMVDEIKMWNKRLFLVSNLWIFALPAFLFVSKGSYIHDKIDQQTEFITNYGNVLQVGDVVSALSTPKDTLFVDGYDDMIYFVAHRYSSYQYSWFTSLMPQYKKYTDARIAMFHTSPPDFYYGNCPNQKAPYYLLPKFIHDDYMRLYNLKDQ